MAKRLMIVIAFLLPSLPLLAFFWLEANGAAAELANLERLTPQNAAQLNALPEGQEVLIEGWLDLRNTRSLEALPIRIVGPRYLDADLVDLSEQGMYSQVTAPFVVAVPDGSIRVINQDYVLQNPLHTIELTSRRQQSGLALGDRVIVIGIVTHDAHGAAVQAKVVAGGTRADYVAVQQRNAAVPGKIVAVPVLLLLVILSGLGLWLMRKRTQRYAPAAI